MAGRAGVEGPRCGEKWSEQYLLPHIPVFNLAAPHREAKAQVSPRDLEREGLHGSVPWTSTEAALLTPKARSGEARPLPPDILSWDTRLRSPEPPC